MKSKITNVLMFAAGAAIGSAVTWKLMKTKYDRIVQEEIDSVREVFGREDQDQSSECDEDESEAGEEAGVHQINWDELEDLDEEDDDEEPEYVPTGADRDEYEELTRNYTSEKGGAKEMAKEPYVISPLDFGELDEYHQIELTYYEGDDILEDEEYNIVRDRDELIGPKALYTFGEFEDDAVFVRNERLQTDFQILKDYRAYSEARGTSPDMVDHE